MRSRQPKTIMGLNISIRTKAKAKAKAIQLAHDLTQLQAKVFRQADKQDFLDQAPEEGHLNYELNKFGIAVQQAIKADLRANPERSLFQFYVYLLEACHAAHNFEIAARVCGGMNDAIFRDAAAPGVFEFQEEGKAVKQARAALKSHQEKITGCVELMNIAFPTPAKAKDIYGRLIESKTAFIPSIQAVMNYIAIRLDNAGSCYIDDNVSPENKLSRLKEMKEEILQELDYIFSLFDRLPPEKPEKPLHFESLVDLFDASLQMNLDPPLYSPSEMLSEKLKINKLEAESESKADVKNNAQSQPVMAKKVFTKSPRCPNLTRLFSVRVEDKDGKENTLDGGVKPKSPRGK